MYITEHLLAPSGVQSISIKAGSQILKVLSSTNSYGNTEILLYALENDDPRLPVIRVNIHSITNHVSFDEQDLEYVDSVLITDIPPFVPVHLFMETF